MAEHPPKSQVRIEAARTLAADPDLRLVSERSEDMRTEIGSTMNDGHPFMYRRVQM